MLKGDRLYVDLQEINPPLIVALNLPAVLLARPLGVSDILMWRLLMTAALLGSLAFSAWALRWTLGPRSEALRRRLTLVLAFALFLEPGESFGQREHLLVALTLPYVVLAFGRVTGRPAASMPAFVAGVLAGIGLALKPHFLLVWAAVEGYAGWRVRARRISPEALGTASVLAVYLIGILVLTPQYFQLVRLLGPAYAGFGHYPFLQVLVTAPGTAVCYLAVLTYVALRTEAEHRALWTVMLVALITSFVAGAAQLKGWLYHFYPATVFALALPALAVLDIRRPLARPMKRIYAAVGFATLGTVMIWSTWIAIERVRHRDPGRQSQQAQLDQLVSAVRRDAPAAASLYVFSFTIESGFPLVNYSGVRWASRFPHLWIIEAVYQDQLHAPGPLRYHAPEEMGPAERYLNDAVYQDLARYRPDVLMVLKHARDVPENTLRRVDYLAYFGRDQRIAGELRNYRRVDDVGQYLVYVRARSSGQPGVRPKSEPGMHDVLRREVSNRGQALVADRAFVVNTVMFLILLGGALVTERRRAFSSS